MNKEVDSRLHKTKRIPVLEADIDIDIAPLVQLMGQMSGVTPQWSCQGTEASEHGTYLPYISFDCWDNESMQIIKALAYQTALKTNESITLSYNLTYHPVHLTNGYNLSFESSRSRDEFYRLLRENIPFHANESNRTTVV